MALDTMYAGKVNSPATTLDGGINDSVTTINVVDGGDLPDAPNIAVIGTGEDAETILYGAKNANELSSVTRGFEGTAKAWDSGTSIARLFTAYDYDTLKSNITDLDSRLGETNTASNIGGYEEIFKQKEGVDLEFRTLRAGTGIDLYNSVPTGTWDITNCSYDTISKSVSSQDSAPYALAFNSDGSKMYILGYTNDTVFQYTLSTPWNVSTATYDNVSKSVSSQESAPRGVAFNSDGSKMYIVGSVNKTVYQYTLSTPWNVGTATYDSVSVSVNSQDSAPYGIAFNSDGSKMYIVGNTNDTVYQYTLSTPWNVGTATYDNVSKSVSSQDSSPYGVAFNSDGSKMYIVGNTNKTVYQYTLSTPWNVGTATYDMVSKDVSSQDSAPRGVAFNSDGSKMYIVGNTNDTVYQYTVGGTTEYDYVQIDIDIPDDSTKFLDGDGIWRVLAEADISDLGSYLEVNLTSPAKGDILYYDGDNWVNLGIGTSGQVLTVSAGGIPEWATP